MNEPIEEQYFNWLCAKVLPVDVPTSIPIYRDLMRILYKTEFVWVLSRDRNRAEDGRELRIDFFRERFMKKDLEWCDMPCSVLEAFIAFANRASFQTDTPARDWFWQFISNLELDEYRRVSNPDIPDIEEVLHIFMWRTYKDNGRGGMFPMRWPKNDQREVEIWYQFCEYLEDQGLI